MADPESIVHNIMGKKKKGKYHEEHESHEHELHEHMYQLISMQDRRAFASPVSFADAEMQARLAGYIVIGSARSKQGHYVVFGRPHGMI